MGLEKNGEITNGKQISVRIPENIYNLMLKDKKENTSLNEVVYDVLLNHYMDVDDQKLSLEKIDVFAYLLAKEIYRDVSEGNKEGLLLESYLQVVRSKILRILQEFKIGGNTVNEQNN